MSRDYSFTAIQPGMLVSKALVGEPLWCTKVLHFWSHFLKGPDLAASLFHDVLYLQLITGTEDNLVASCLIVLQNTIHD